MSDLRSRSSLQPSLISFYHQALADWISSSLATLGLIIRDKVIAAHARDDGAGCQSDPDSASHGVSKWIKLSVGRPS